MNSKNELKEIHIKNRVCYDFDNMINLCLLKNIDFS